MKKTKNENVLYLIFKHISPLFRIKTFCKAFIMVTQILLSKQYPFIFCKLCVYFTYKNKYIYMKSSYMYIENNPKSTQYKEQIKCMFCFVDCSYTYT